MHEILDVGVEVVRREEQRLVGRLDIGLLDGVRVCEFFGAGWAPLIDGDQIVIEDFTHVDSNQLTIVVIGDTTSIVSLGD